MKNELAKELVEEAKKEHITKVINGKGKVKIIWGCL